MSLQNTIKERLQNSQDVVWVVKHVPLQRYITITDIITDHLEQARAFGEQEAKDYCKNMPHYSIAKVNLKTFYEEDIILEPFGTEPNTDNYTRGNSDEMLDLYKEGGRL